MAVIYFKLATRAYRTMLSFAAEAKEPYACLYRIPCRLYYSRPVRWMLKVWKVCRTLTPANLSEAIVAALERPATQSVSKPVDPGRDSHRWSVAGTGVGPETVREMKLKTVTSVWECSTSAPVQAALATCSVATSCPIK
jgi:hypothetical protein